jgi:hypothetical protein
MGIGSADSHIPPPQRRLDVRKKNHDQSFSDRSNRWVVVGLACHRILISA